MDAGETGKLEGKTCRKSLKISGKNRHTQEVWDNNL